MDEKGAIHKVPDMDLMRNDLFSVSVSDAETKNTINEAWHLYRLLLEPHGAVGWAGLQHYLNEHKNETPDQLYIVLETAHPAKFPEQIQEILKFDPELPSSLQGLEEKDEHFLQMENGYEAFKDYLLKNY